MILNEWAEYRPFGYIGRKKLNLFTFNKILKNILAKEWKNQMPKIIFKHAGKATATEVLIPQKLKLQKESEAFNDMGKLTFEPNFLEK